MQVPDAQIIAQTLSGGPVRGRKCERRNIVGRFRKGSVKDITQRDIHYIRQARFIARVGRATYDDLHTIRGIPMNEIGENPVVTQTLFQFAQHLKEQFGIDAVDVDRDLQTVSVSLSSGSLLFAWKANQTFVAVMKEGFIDPDEMTKLTRADLAMDGELGRAFKTGIRSGYDPGFAEQLQLAAYGIQAGNGPIYA